MLLTHAKATVPTKKLVKERAFFHEEFLQNRQKTVSFNRKDEGKEKIIFDTCCSKVTYRTGELYKAITSQELQPEPKKF